MPFQKINHWSQVSISRSFLLAVVLGISGIVVAQDDENRSFKKPEPKKVSASNAPVTRTEAKKVFDKAWKVLSKGLNIKGSNPISLATGAQPVTKNEVLQQFDRLIKASQSKFKRLPRKLKFDAKRIRTDAPLDLSRPWIEYGFISPYGPLMTGKVNTVTTYEFGDSLGQVMVRIADLTHTPTRKFTPFLQPIE